MADYNYVKETFEEEKTISAPSEEEEKVPAAKMPKTQEYDNFGYVTPDGSFIPSDYGTHEESAIKIVKEMGWMKERRNSVYDLCRDFLVYVKGYALIHNPLMDGGYIVTHNPAKDLTKAQRETLYDYFTENGDSYLANAMFSQEEDYER